MIENNKVPESDKFFPHMMPNDKTIWLRFLEAHSDMFDKYDYDVRVGDGVESINPVPAEYQKMITALTQKRIDVVATKGSVVYVIEVKPDAGLSAFGQIQAYEYLFRYTWKYQGELNKVVITDSIDPDTMLVMLENDVIVYVV